MCVPSTSTHVVASVRHRCSASPNLASHSTVRGPSKIADSSVDDAVPPHLPRLRLRLPPFHHRYTPDAQPSLISHSRRYTLVGKCPTTREPWSCRFLGSPSLGRPVTWQAGRQAGRWLSSLTASKAAHLASRAFACSTALSWTCRLSRPSVRRSSPNTTRRARAREATRTRTNERGRTRLGLPWLLGSHLHSSWVKGDGTEPASCVC
ncbi:hypothetical protein LX36DRAFT_74959 [Colletotrichum falcatum]|nr:hypothetical protein LX36DRAFT_74959 [Colletotrichum falcatum]